MTDAFYIMDGENRFISTDWTTGPWDPGFQHAGPPSALMGWVVERDRDDGKQVARATFEILRPVPVAPMEITVRVVRPGKKIELVHAVMTSGSQEIMTAAVWRMRTTQLDFAPPETRAPPSQPEDGTAVEPFPSGPRSYLTAMQWIFTRGEFMAPGPATAWARMQIPLVAGEEVRPLTRVLVLADSGNGISAVLDFSQWLFVNPDLSVYLHRMPEGEWVCLEAETMPQQTGVGVARSTLYDTRGVIGVGMQSLFIEARG